MIPHDSKTNKPTKPQGNRPILVNPPSFSPFQPPTLPQSLPMSPSQRPSQQQNSSRETPHDKYANKMPNEGMFRRWLCATSDPATSGINVNSNVHRPPHQETRASSDRIKKVCRSWSNSEGLIMWCRNRSQRRVTCRYQHSLGL